MTKGDRLLKNYTIIRNYTGKMTAEELIRKIADAHRESYGGKEVLKKVGSAGKIRAAGKP